MGFRPFRLILSSAGLFALVACFEAQAPAPVARYSPGAGAGSTGIHTAMQGETLWLISKRYSIAARDIAALNNLQAPFVLRPGQRLTLPPPQQYMARAGDSLSTVSRLFGVSQSEIAKMNNIRAPYTLRAGQALRLPSITERQTPQVFADTTPMNTIPGSADVAAVVAEPLAAPPVQSVELAPPMQTAGQMPAGMPPQPGVVVQEPSKIAATQPPVPKGPISTKIPKRSSKKFMKPVKGTLISGYGPKKDGLFNDGMNIRAAQHAPVVAAENGVVVYVGDELKASGNLILIKHEDRWMTAYAHLGDIKIRRGDVVKRGQTIGTVGSTGAVDAPQLHFEVRRGTEALNPEVYMEG